MPVLRFDPQADGAGCRAVTLIEYAMPKLFPRLTGPATLSVSLLASLMLAGAATGVQAQVLEEEAGQTAPQATQEAPANPRVSEPISLSYNFAVATDYSTRGISQTGGKPVVQAGVEASSGYFYGGVWGSNVDFGDSTKAEIDFYTGVRSQTKGIDWDLRALGYIYVDQPKGGEYNYLELRGSVAKDFGKARLGAIVYYSPDYFGTTSDEGVFAQLTGAYTLNDRLSVSGAVGRQWVPGPNDHTTWHFGPTWQATKKLALDLRYYDTNRHDLGSNHDSRVVLAVKTAF